MKSEKLYIWEYTSGNLRKKIESGLLCTDSSKYQFFSSFAAWKSASTLRLFWLQSQLLNLAEEPDVYSLLYQNLWFSPAMIVHFSFSNTYTGYTGCLENDVFFLPQEYKCFHFNWDYIYTFCWKKRSHKSTSSLIPWELVRHSCIWRSIMAFSIADLWIT